MRYRIYPPILNTALEMPQKTYDELKTINLFFERENITEKAKLISLGGGFCLICPEKELEAVND